MRCDAVLRGRRFVLYTLRRDTGKCPVQEFIAGLQERDKKRLMALLEHTKDNGPPKNREKCRKIATADGLFEFKSYQDRVIWFYDGNERDGRGRIVMTHGFCKKDDRMPLREQRQAEQMRAEFLEDRERWR